MLFERRAQALLTRLREARESDGEDFPGALAGGLAAPAADSPAVADSWAPTNRRPDGRAAVPSWFYHDGLGNRVYVQDMNFSNALALGRAGAGTPGPTGAFAAEPRVVLVPRHKTTSWTHEFSRKHDNHSAALAALHEERLNRVPTTEGARSCRRQVPNAALGRPETAPGARRRGIVWADMAGAVGVTDDVDKLAAELQRLRNEEWRLSRDVDAHHKA